MPKRCVVAFDGSSAGEMAVIALLLTRLHGKGVPIETAIKYGDVTDTICDVAKEAGANQMIAERTGENGIVSRMFGSVAGALVQVAPGPCTVVP